MAMLHESVRCILLILCVVSGCWTGCYRDSLLDCQDYMDLGHNSSGVYRVVPLGMHSEMNVYCDMVEDDEGWIVIQRRINGSIDFYQKWESYEAGFGDIEHEFWIGLLPLWRLLVQGHFQLRINIEDWKGTTKYAHFDCFMIDGPADKYSLHVHRYTGTAGDSLSVLNGQEFSTRDRDNDGNSKECAAERKGGWWYANGDLCGPSGLNGKRFKINSNTQNKLKGILWTSWKNDYSFKSTEMKIKRV